MGSTPSTGGVSVSALPASQSQPYWSGAEGTSTWSFDRLYLGVATPTASSGSFQFGVSKNPSNDDTPALNIYRGTYSGNSVATLTAEVATGIDAKPVGNPKYLNGAWYWPTNKGVIRTTSASGWSYYVDWSSSPNDANCGIFLFHEDAVIVSDSNNRLWRFTGSTSQEITEPDDLAVEAQGDITAAEVHDGNLYIAVGGGEVGKTAHVYLFDPVGDWHIISALPAENIAVAEMKSSGLPDGTRRLHVRANNDLMYALASTDSINPRTSMNPVIPSYIELPEFIGGFPADDKLFLRTRADIEYLNVGTTESLVEVLYGLDGAKPTISAGYIDRVTRQLELADVGLLGKSIRLRYLLHIDPCTPIGRVFVRPVELEYVVIPDRRRTYELVIDLERTAESRSSGYVPSIRKELEAAEEQKTMMEFQIEGRDSTKVIVEPRSVTEADQFNLPSDFNHRVDKYMKLTELR